MSGGYGANRMTVEQARPLIWVEHKNRAVIDAGYQLTWAYAGGVLWINAWAPRQEGQRRGKHLGAGRDRKELETICAMHLAAQKMVPA